MTEQLIMKDDLAYLAEEEVKILDVALPSFSVSLEESGSMRLRKERLDFFHTAANLDKDTITMHQMFALLKIYFASRGMSRDMQVKYDEKSKSILIKRSTVEWEKKAKTRRKRRFF